MDFSFGIIQTKPEKICGMQSMAPYNLSAVIWPKGRIQKIFRESLTLNKLVISNQVLKPKGRAEDLNMRKKNLIRDKH